MATPINQPPPAGKTNYLPWVLGGGGPDGPGYYRKVGSAGGYEKLNQGFP